MLVVRGQEFVRLDFREKYVYLFLPPVNDQYTQVNKLVNIYQIQMGAIYYNTLDKNVLRDTQIKFFFFTLHRE